jgi:hypothetical protein
MKTVDEPLDVPVLFLVFNRPETTQQVFDAIRKVRPIRLYVVADGSREAKGIEEFKRCMEVRKIATAVDWDCEVFTLFRNVNMGCGLGLSSAITWFFQHETEGIILEDDCLPSTDFFRFTAELLTMYRDDTRIMGIGSNNFEEINNRDNTYSYRFTKQTYIWGWATWRRAWQLNDFHMSHYPEIENKNYLEPLYPGIYERDYLQYVFKKMHTGDEKISSRTIWSYQWQFSCLIHSGLIIVPNSNLVINVGIGVEATNTHDPETVGHNLIFEEFNFPLQHPPFIMVHQSRDMKVFKTMITSATSRFKSHIKNLIPKYMLEKWVLPTKQLLKKRKKVNAPQYQTR